VPYLSLSTDGNGDVHEAASVDVTLVCAALGGLLLLGPLNLGSLRLDLAWERETRSVFHALAKLVAIVKLTSASERAVNFAHFDGFGEVYWLKRMVFGCLSVSWCRFR